MSKSLCPESAVIERGAREIHSLTHTVRLYALAYWIALLHFYTEYTISNSQYSSVSILSVSASVSALTLRRLTGF